MSAPPPAAAATRDVIVRAESLETARAFYEGALGLPAAQEGETLLRFDAGGLRLFVEQGAPPHGPVHEFLVPDVEAAKARLIAAGCTLVEEDASVPRCYLRDPFGLVFNIGKARAG